MTSPAPVRVLVVIDALGQGGAEHSLAAMLPRLGPHGVKAEVVCRYRADSHVEELLTNHGVPVSTMPKANPIAATRWLRQRVRQDRPSLVHLNLFVPTMVGTAATLGAGVPVLVSLVNTPQTSNPDVATWKLRTVAGAEALACRRFATVVHAVTPGVRDAAVGPMRIPAGKVRVTERGRDATRFHPPEPAERSAARTALDLLASDEVVVAVGRHEHQKGFEHLLDAVAVLQASRPKLVVLIAGKEGNLTSALRSRMAALPRPDGVRLLGDRRDVEVVLQAADAFVLSSLREGAAGAAVEAMATGLPIVASDLAGTRGILRHDGEALLVPPGDAPALALALAEVLDEPLLARSLGATGLATYQARFTLDRAVAALADLYREVAALPASSAGSFLHPGRHGHPAADH
ncbi:N/A [soil metagenome]